MDQILKRTPLYDEHLKLGAKMVEFGGWDMPVFYSSIIDEHNTVRKKAGLFDTSHMGEIIVSGPESVMFLERFTTASVADLPLCRARYSFFLNEGGGVIDDLIIYRRSNDFLLVVNASNLEMDLQWLNSNRKSGVNIRDISGEACLIALQGPESAGIMNKILIDEVAGIKYFSFFEARFKSINPGLSFVARTGYTGEDGFELLISKEFGGKLWGEIISLGVKPCGLGARDTLRLEACMPLHGHELDEKTTPLEAGLENYVNWKGDFFGKSALLSQKEKGLPKHLLAFELESGIPRANCDIMTDGKLTGKVTSGSFSPTLRKGVGLGYFSNMLSEGSKVEVVVNSQPKGAKIVSRPFYKRAR